MYRTEGEESVAALGGARHVFPETTITVSPHPCGWTSHWGGARGEVVGTETLDVGGTAVTVLHYRLDTTFEGATKGTRVSEFWVTPDTGLVVKTTHTDDVETDSAIGFTHYEDRVELTLESLTPRT